MKIQDLFTENISREIEGVVKIANESDLLKEMHEFVITTEIRRALNEFYNQYKKEKSVDPGVWLSGFFGTGKSHLLKIMSLVLSNREVDGIQLGKIFIEKVRATGDFDLEGTVNEAIRIPTQTIAFNIESTIDNNYRDSDNNIFLPMKKKFDMALGLSDIPQLAKMERDLIYKGKFEIFKEIYKRISGDEWTVARENLLVISDEIDRAFAEALDQDLDSVRGITDRYEKITQLSIDEFIKDIKQYLAIKPANFRLVFLVDEVGQYISHDNRTMLNLQTLIEDFSTAFENRVWVIATAQEELTEIIRNMNQTSQTDFSKILTRFTVKIKLSSSNAGEVIRKRLLYKKPDADQMLRGLFNSQAAVIKTKLTFAGTIEFNNKLPDEESFSSHYPILPYQVELFQKCLIALSIHGALEGSYTSVGARSMLGVFHYSLQMIREREVGNLVPFDHFFEGASELLKKQPYHSILVYENSKSDPFGVRLLKLLYLLKYVNGFTTTVKNIAVLMMDNTDQDRSQLEAEIQTSLDTLVRYNYVQEVNNIYEFQTDIQQDVVKGIKAISLQSGEIRNYVAEQFYSGMLAKNNILKLKHDRTGLEFPYTKKIDRHDFSKPYGEISLQLITGVEDNYPNETELSTLAMAPYELLVVLPKNNKLIEDVALYLKTNKYATQNKSLNSNDEKQSVISAKLRENETRRQSMVALLKILADEARFFFNGSQIPSSSQDFYIRLKEAAQFLIEGAYFQLKKVVRVPKKDDLAKLFVQMDAPDLIAEFAGFSEVENELLNHLNKSFVESGNTKLDSILVHFKKIPYGYFDDLIIENALINLYLNGKVNLYYNVSEINKADVLRRVTNSKDHTSITVKPNEDISAELVQQAREFHFRWFAGQIQANDVNVVEVEIKEDMREEAQKLRDILFRQEEYSFIHPLDGPLKVFEKALTLERFRFFEYIAQSALPLLNGKDDIDRILNFMNGPNRKLYDNIAEFLNQNKSDLEQIESDNIEKLTVYIQSATPYLNVQYNVLNNAFEDLKRQLQAAADDLRADMLKTVEINRELLPGFGGYEKLTEEDKTVLEKVIDKYTEKINGSSSITSLKLIQNGLQTGLVKDMHQKIHDLLTPVVVETKGGGDESLPPRPVSSSAVKLLSLKELLPSYDGSLIESPAAVEKYLSSLKQKMLSEIEKGHKLIP